MSNPEATRYAAQMMLDHSIDLDFFDSFLAFYDIDYDAREIHDSIDEIIEGSEGISLDSLSVRGFLVNEKCFSMLIANNDGENIERLIKTRALHPSILADKDGYFLLDAFNNKVNPPTNSIYTLLEYGFSKEDLTLEFTIDCMINGYVASHILIDYAEFTNDEFCAALKEMDQKQLEYIIEHMTIDLLESFISRKVFSLDINNLIFYYIVKAEKWHIIDALVTEKIIDFNNKELFYYFASPREEVIPEFFASAISFPDLLHHILELDFFELTQEQKNGFSKTGTIYYHSKYKFDRILKLMQLENHQLHSLFKNCFISSDYNEELINLRINMGNDFLFFDFVTEQLLVEKSHTYKLDWLYSTYSKEKPELFIHSAYKNITRAMKRNEVLAPTLVDHQKEFISLAKQHLTLKERAELTQGFYTQHSYERLIEGIRLNLRFGLKRWIQRWDRDKEHAHNSFLYLFLLPLFSAKEYGNILNNFSQEPTDKPFIETLVNIYNTDILSIMNISSLREETKFILLTLLNDADDD